MTITEAKQLVFWLRITPHTELNNASLYLFDTPVMFIRELHNLLAIQDQVLKSYSYFIYYLKLFFMQEYQKDQNIFSIRKDGEVVGRIESKDGNLLTSGSIGENTYTSWVDLIKGLQGFGIAIDNFYW